MNASPRCSLAHKSFSNGCHWFVAIELYPGCQFTSHVPWHTERTQSEWRSAKYFSLKFTKRRWGQGAEVLSRKLLVCPCLFVWRMKWLFVLFLLLLLLLSFLLLLVNTPGYQLNQLYLYWTPRQIINNGTSFFHSNGTLVPWVMVFSFYRNSFVHPSFYPSLFLW